MYWIWYVNKINKSAVTSTKWSNWPKQHSKDIPMRWWLSNQSQVTSQQYDFFHISCCYWTRGWGGRSMVTIFIVQPTKWIEISISAKFDCRLLDLVFHTIRVMTSFEYFLVIRRFQIKAIWKVMNSIPNITRMAFPHF